MPDSIIRYIWQYSRTRQIGLVILTLASFPLLYASLEIPKLIINQVLSGQPGLRQFMGIDWEPLHLLLVLSFLMLFLVLINGLLKMYINTRKGVVGESIVRRLRYQLMTRLLRFPPRKFQVLSQGEVIASVVQETDPLGGFAGDAFAHPILQAGTLLTIVLFMFVQNWLLGLASIAMVPVQLFIIPRLQRQINQLRKKRVKRVRSLSNRIGETVDAANEIRIQGTRRYTLAEFAYRFGDLYYIRLELFKKKFFMKFLNNLLNQVTPFMFYALGGYLVLQGQLTVGALIAAISAHKDFLAPWRELLSFYQTWQDNIVRYRQVVEQFSPYDLQASPVPHGVADKQLFEQPLQLKNVILRDEYNEPLINLLNLEVAPGEWLAIQSGVLSQRNALARCLVALEKPQAGLVGLGGTPLVQLNEAFLRLNIAYSDEHPHLFNSNIAHNMAYGLNHLAPEPETEEQRKRLQDSIAAGNGGDWFDESFSTIWSDLPHLGVNSFEELQPWMQEQFTIIGNREILLQLSLNEVFNPLDFPEELFAQLIDDLLIARHKVKSELKQEHSQYNIDHYVLDELNRFAPLSDNLIFGTLVGNTQELRPVLLTVLTAELQKQGIFESSLKIAAKGLQHLLLKLPHLPADHRFIEQFELYDTTRVEMLRRLRTQLENDSYSRLTEAAYEQPLMDIFVRMMPCDWLDIWQDPEYIAQLIVLRHRVMQRLQDEFGSAYFPFTEGKYNPGLSVLNNVLYGRADPKCPTSLQLLRERAAHHVMQQADEDALIRLFIINTRVGVNGSRIPEHIHHRISLLRNLLKRPHILVLKDALDGSSAEDKIGILQRLKTSRPDLTLIWVNEHLPAPYLFDRHLILDQEGLHVSGSV